MNLVQTAPELQVASLNGINGLGYAEVIASGESGISCRGVIIFDEDTDLAALEIAWRSGKAMFTGIVYHEDHEEEVSLPVQIRLLSQDERHEPGATFVARLKGTGLEGN